MVIKQKLIPIFKCPLCDFRKKPLISIRALNNHIAKQHPEYNFRFTLTVQRQAVRRRKKLSSRRK